MSVDIVAAIALSSILAILVAVFTLYLKTVRPIIILSPFILTISLLAILGGLGVDTYPYSNVLVLAAAILGGSLIGKTIWKNRLAFPVILLAFSIFDILSFVPGPNTSSTNQSLQNGSALLLYLNFTVRLTQSSHFILGSLDLLILSTAVMFFAMRRVPKSRVLVFGLTSFLLPLIYLLVIPTSGGLPLLPFIATTALVFSLLSRRTDHNVCSRFRIVFTV